MKRSLTTRERNLAIIVTLIVALGGTWLLIDSYLGHRASLNARIASGNKQLRSMRELLGQTSLWERREQWLQAKQPRLENPDTAGVQLLDSVQGLARRHTVLLGNAAIRAPDPRPNCISVAVEIDTTSGWPPLVEFLEELQTPEQFVALESVNLQVNPADNTQVHGHFKIARWYAPN